MHAVPQRNVMEICLLAVLPSHWGQGFGQRLLEAVETRSRAETFTTGMASCRTDVMPFFEKMGYKVGAKSLLSADLQMPDEIGLKKVRKRKNIFPQGKNYPDTYIRSNVAHVRCTRTVIHKISEFGGPSRS